MSSANKISYINKKFNTLLFAFLVLFLFSCNRSTFLDSSNIVTITLTGRSNVLINTPDTLLLTVGGTNATANYSLSSNVNLSYKSSTPTNLFPNFGNRISNDTFTYTPTDVGNGYATITITATDAYGNKASASSIVVISNVFSFLLTPFNSRVSSNGLIVKVPQLITATITNPIPNSFNATFVSSNPTDTIVFKNQKYGSGQTIPLGLVTSVATNAFSFTPNNATNTIATIAFNITDQKSNKTLSDTFFYSAQNIYSYALNPFTSTTNRVSIPIGSPGTINIPITSAVPGNTFYLKSNDTLTYNGVKYKPYPTDSISIGRNFSPTVTFTPTKIGTNSLDIMVTDSISNTTFPATTYFYQAIQNYSFTLSPITNASNLYPIVLGVNQPITVNIKSLILGNTFTAKANDTLVYNGVTYNPNSLINFGTNVSPTVYLKKTSTTIPSPLIIAITDSLSKITTSQNFNYQFVSGFSYSITPSTAANSPVFLPLQIPQTIGINISNIKLPTASFTLQANDTIYKSDGTKVLPNTPFDLVGPISTNTTVPITYIPYKPSGSYSITFTLTETGSQTPQTSTFYYTIATPPFKASITTPAGNSIGNQDVLVGVTQRGIDMSINAVSGTPSSVSYNVVPNDAVSATPSGVTPTQFNAGDTIKFGSGVTNPSFLFGKAGGTPPGSGVLTFNVSQSNIPSKVFNTNVNYYYFIPFTLSPTVLNADGTPNSSGNPQRGIDASNKVLTITGNLPIPNTGQYNANSSLAFTYFAIQGWNGIDPSFYDNSNGQPININDIVPITILAGSSTYSFQLGINAKPLYQNGSLTIQAKLEDKTTGQVIPFTVYFLNR